MILVDSCVWIEHFRRADARLSQLIEQNLAAIHPLIIQELACGELKPREETLDLLESLPRVLPASHQETLALTHTRGLHGTGLGAVDVHLLASALLTPAKIWTEDISLARAARKLNVDYN